MTESSFRIFFRTITSRSAPTEVTSKTSIVAGVASAVCQVRSYSVDHFELKLLDKTTALLTYRETQDTLCNGNAVPTPCWVSSLYMKRGDRWMNVVYQQTQIAR